LDHPLQYRLRASVISWTSQPNNVRTEKKSI